MTSRSRWLAWLLLALCSPLALADSPAIVRDGKVIDDGEYREQQEFGGVLAGLVNALPANAERGGIEQGVQALVAGFATWALAAYVIDVGGAQRELLEGCTALFAAVMVLWLGVWMHDRRHAAAWQGYIKTSLLSGVGRRLADIGGVCFAGKPAPTGAPLILNAAAYL